MDKKQAGGKRTGAGRKPKDPTAVITFRVPADKAKELKIVIAACIQNYLNPSQHIPAEIPKLAIKNAPQKPINKEPTLAELWKQMNSQK